MKNNVQYALRIFSFLLLVTFLLPVHGATAFGPDNGAADLNKWYGITGDYLNASGLEGFIIDDLKNSLTSTCLGLTLAQVAVDIAYGDYGQAWNTCQQTGIETALGFTSAIPFYAAGKLLVTSLQSVQDTALTAFTGKLFTQYKRARIDNVNWDRVKKNKPAVWLKDWLAMGPRDFEDFWELFGDSGEINASYRSTIMARMKADCGFTRKLLTFGSCNEDIMGISFTDKEIKKWLYNSWEPQVIREVMNRAVNERKAYIEELRKKTTFLVTWSLKVPFGKPVWSTFNGYKGKLSGDQYSVEFKYDQALRILGRPEWSFAYGTKVIVMVGALPNDVVKITPPRNLGMSKGTGSRVIIDIGQVLVSSSEGILMIRNTGSKSIGIVNLGSGVPAKSENTYWLPQGKYTLHTTVGLRTVTIRNGRTTTLVLSQPVPPPMPDPTQASVKARIDQMAAKIRSGRMGLTAGLGTGESWREHKKLIIKETGNIESRLRYADGSEHMGNLGYWAKEYLEQQEYAFKNEADSMCTGRLTNELALFGKEWQSIDEDLSLGFDKLNIPSLQSLPEPGDPAWGNPPHGRDSRQNSRMISEAWLSYLDKMIARIKVVNDSKKLRIRRISDWKTAVENSVNAMETRYVFLADWSTEATCTNLYNQAANLLFFATSQVPVQILRLQKDRNELGELAKKMQTDRVHITKAIAAYKKAAAITTSNLNTVLTMCGSVVNDIEQGLAEKKAVLAWFNPSKFHLRNALKLKDGNSPEEVRDAWGEQLTFWSDTFPEKKLPLPQYDDNYSYFVRHGDPTPQYFATTRKAIAQLVQANVKFYSVNTIRKKRLQLNWNALLDADINDSVEWQNNPQCRKIDEYRVVGSECHQCVELLDKVSKLQTWWIAHKRLLTWPPLPAGHQSISAQPVPAPVQSPQPITTQVRGTVKVILDVAPGINPSRITIRVTDQRGNIVAEGPGPHKLAPGKYFVNTYGRYLETDPSTLISLGAGQRETVRVRVWQDDDEKDDFPPSPPVSSGKVHTPANSQTGVNPQPHEMPPVVVGDTGTPETVHGGVLPPIFHDTASIRQGIDSFTQKITGDSPATGFHKVVRLTVTGNWIDDYGNKVAIVQNGQEFIATPFENKGQVGWKTARGRIEVGRIVAGFNSLQLIGNVEPQGNTIHWSNGVAWRRIGGIAAGHSDLQCRGEEHWNETELGWSAVWTQRNNSNKFDARWNLDGRVEKAVLTISRHGRNVIVHRRQKHGSSYPGQECTYTGTVSPDNSTVTGSYRCDWAAGPFSWRATIIPGCVTDSPADNEVGPVGVTQDFGAGRLNGWTKSGAGDRLGSTQATHAPGGKVKIEFSRTLHGQRSGKRYYGFTSGKVVLPHKNGGILRFTFYNDQLASNRTALNVLNIHIGKKLYSVEQYTTRLDLKEMYKEFAKEWGPGGGAAITLRVPTGISEVIFSKDQSLSGIELADFRFQSARVNNAGVDIKPYINRSHQVLMQFPRIIYGRISGKAFYGYTSGTIILPNRAGGTLSCSFWNDQNGQFAEILNYLYLQAGNTTAVFQQKTSPVMKTENYKEFADWGPAGNIGVSFNVPPGKSKVTVNNKGSRTGVELTDCRFDSR